MLFTLRYWLASHLEHLFLAIKLFTENALAAAPLSPWPPAAPPHARPPPLGPQELQDEGGGPRVNIN